MSFSYYIHDSVTTFRFQLVGSLRKNHIAELKSVWETARGTLGTRAIVLDLSRLQESDATAREWLQSMIAEGASCTPAIATQTAAIKLSLLGRVMGVLRGEQTAVKCR